MTDWKKTNEAGIYRHPEIDGKFKIHTTATDPDTGKVEHRRKTIKNATMLDAQKVRDQLKAAIRQTAQQKQAPHLRLACFAGRWARERIDDGHWSERTAGTNIQILEDHILPRLGLMTLPELNREAIRDWISYAEDSRREVTGDDGKPELVPYANASLRRWWAVLKQLVRAVYLEGYFDPRMMEWLRARKGPTSKVSPRRELETLTRDELNRYLDKAKLMAPRRFAEIVTLACTGMRAGELYGLEWCHVDYDAETIRVEQSWVGPRKNREGHLKSTKTGTARIVPMIPKVADALQSQRQRLVREQNTGLREGIVYPADNGARRTASSIHKTMSKIAEACGIDVKVGPQVLRKTFITLMGNVGVRREMVKAISGHSTNEMHDHYTNIRPEDRRVAVTRLFGEETG